MYFICMVCFVYVAENEDVVPVFVSKMKKLDTTHSWDFLAIDCLPI